MRDREIKLANVAYQEERDKRKATDPFYIWEPFEKQKPFIESVLKGLKNENWFVGANRSGKSDVGTYCGTSFARFGDRSNTKTAYHEGGRLEIRDFATSGWVISLDYPSSRDIVQPKYFDNGFVPAGTTHAPLIPEREIKKRGWKQQDQVLQLKNGSIIGFKSAESGRKKFQGTEKDWIHIDEECPKGIYEESTIRVGQRPLKIFGTCTLLPPEGQIGGVTWVYSDILKPFMRGDPLLCERVGAFGASIYDNPYIDEGEIRRLESIYPEGSVGRRIRLNGEWLPGLGGARAYPSFAESIHANEEQPEILYRKPLCWIWDFNVEPMVSLVGQLDLMTYRFRREFIMEEGNIPEMCDIFREVFPKHGAEIYVYGDATGSNRNHQTGKSSYTLILNSMRTYPAPVRLKIPEVNPAVPDRINAVNRLFKDEVGESRVSIDPSCVELIADFEQVLRDPRGGIKKTFNKKDPYFRRTHVSDAAGYWLSKEEPVLGTQFVTERVNVMKTLKSAGYGGARR